jgi:putative peptide zinc metalloprotease protein
MRYVPSGNGHSSASPACGRNWRLRPGALYLWLVLEPGALRGAMHNVVLVAGVSTLVFNANPLLKFDGYYILADLVEIPNLAQRSNEYWLWRLRRHLLGDREATEPPATAGERRWFVAYAPAALIYRLMVMLAIALFVAQEYLFVGALVAAVAVFTTLVLPLGKALAWLAASPALARKRGAAAARASLAVAAVVVLAVAVPLPVWVSAQGIVWVPQCAEVRALESGFVSGIVARNGEAVAAGQAVVTLENEELAAERDRQAARVAAAEIHAVDQLVRDKVGAALAAEAVMRERAALQVLEDRVSNLRAAACEPGALHLNRAEDLVGRFVERGELLGVVLGQPVDKVRVVVPQDDIGLVRASGPDVQVLLLSGLGRHQAGRVLRQVPSGLLALPSAALGPQADGLHAVDPSDPQGLRTLSRVFHFEVVMDAPALPAELGARAFVKYRAPSEPLFAQVARRVRQTLLSKLDV